jgi:hypothetical protein
MRDSGSRRNRSLAGSGFIRSAALAGELLDHLFYGKAIEGLQNTSDYSGPSAQFMV